MALGDVRKIDQMLRDGFPVHVCNNSGRTALHIAVINNRNDIIKLLLHEGADVNRKDIFNKTALHSAALCNNLEAAQLLLNAGADINIKPNNNKTPLDEAPKGTEVELLLQQLQQSAP